MEQTLSEQLSGEFEHLRIRDPTKGKPATAFEAAGPAKPLKGDFPQAGVGNFGAGGDITSGANPSYWLSKEPTMRGFRRLEHDLHGIDVCVIGAGIAGLSVAYNCVQQGLRVAVIEDGEIASGETGRTTAHLAWAVDDRFFELQKMFGKEGALRVAESHHAAIDWIENVCQREGIDCEFRRVNGYLINKYPSSHPSHFKEHKSVMEKEWEAVQKLGLRGIDRLESCPSTVMPGLSAGMTLRFKDQGQFHPTMFINGLAKAISEHGRVVPVSERRLQGEETYTVEGGMIFTHTRASEIKGGAASFVKTANGHTILCRNIVMATNMPAFNHVALVDRLEPYRTYVVGMKIPKGQEWCLVWDTEDPYRYARFTSFDETHDLVIVGGEDHVVGTEADYEGRYRRLANWTRDRWPQAGEVVFKWSGHILEPTDLIGYTGVNYADHPNVFVHTGDSGNGITFGAIGGLVISHLISGGKAGGPVVAQWAKLYDPNRWIRSKTSYASHALGMQLRYAKWLKPSEVVDIEDIKPCSGAVVRDGLKPVAIYRDEKGLVHSFSAVCTHLQGVVSWNQDEQSWDCPVHGSRFDGKTGNFVSGPANACLHPCDIPARFKAKAQRAPLAPAAAREP